MQPCVWSACSAARRAARDACYKDKGYKMVEITDAERALVAKMTPEQREAQFAKWQTGQELSEKAKMP